MMSSSIKVAFCILAFSPAAMPGRNRGSRRGVNPRGVPIALRHDRHQVIGFGDTSQDDVSRENDGRRNWSKIAASTAHQGEGEPMKKSNSAKRGRDLIKFTISELA